jgi:hypothetical protein
VPSCTNVAVSSNGTATCTFDVTHAKIAASYVESTHQFGPSATSAVIGMVPVIATSPSSASVPKGTNHTVVAAANGPGNMTVQWMRSTNGTSFTAIPGATSDSYTRLINAKVYLRAVFTAGTYKARTVPVIISPT